MPAMTRRRFRLIAATAALLASTALVAGSALPAAADTGSHDRRVLTYVALGDSYAAGQATDCTHTASSYPLRLDRLHRVKLLRDAACAGATTWTVRGTQIRALRHGVKLVTLTVGANDLDVAGLQLVCASTPAAASSPACLAAIQDRAEQLPVLFGSLSATYSAIAVAAPRARILVTGYPPLVSSGPLAAAEHALNLTIHSAVATVAATGVNIHYVRVSFRGHTVDSADPWFWLSGPNIFHPNAAGDRAMAVAVARAL